VGNKFKIANGNFEATYILEREGNSISSAHWVHAAKEQIAVTALQ
jgi:hypothetical protein